MKNKKILLYTFIGFIMLGFLIFLGGDQEVNQKTKVQNSQQAQVNSELNKTTKETSESNNENQVISDIENKPTEDNKNQETDKTTLITYVIDGDTVKNEDGESIRLIGINAPESGRPYFSESRNKLIDLVENKEVRLEKDVTDKDQYGRLLRYIWIGDTLINKEMARLGFANSYTYPPDVKYQEEILDAEQEARENERGLWESAEESSDDLGEARVEVVDFNADAPGNDHNNKNEEYFVLKNTGSASINLKGWSSKDEATHTFTFPDFTLNLGSTVTVRTGYGSNTNTDIYWGSDNAVWNNSGDTLYLRNSDGQLILEYSY